MMKNLIGAAGLMILLGVGLTASAYDFVMYDDIGVVYGVTRAGIEVEDHDVYFVDAYVYWMPDCPFGGRGLYFYSKLYGSIKLSVFESKYFYNYSMEGYYDDTGMFKVYWCNSKGKSGVTYLRTAY